MSLEKVLGSVGSFCVNHKYALLATAGVAAVGYLIARSIFRFAKGMLSEMILQAQEGGTYLAHASDQADIGGGLNEHLDCLPLRNGDVLQLRIVENKQKLNQGGKTVIVFNPNLATSESVRSSTAKALSAEYDRIIYWDYPNTGGSKIKSGVADTNNMVEATKQITKLVAQKYHQQDYSKIIFYGWSYGGGVAACAAHSLQKSGVKIGGLICDRTFSSLTSFASNNIGIPRFLAGPALRFLGLELDTKTAFEAFEGPKKSVYCHFDRVIGNAKLTGLGPNYIAVDGGGDTNTHINNSQELQQAISLAR